MPYNPDPKVRAAADFAKEFGADRVIIYYTKANSDEYGYASFGNTECKCGEAKCIAEEVFEHVGRVIVKECS